MTTPRRLVATGYDRIADAYLDRFEHSSVRKKWLRRLIESLPSSGRVLDLGCGAGVPVARELAALGHCVVGVDGSEEQIARARSKVPKATFIHAVRHQSGRGLIRRDRCVLFYYACALCGAGISACKD